ncbi:putative RND superfamily drug exporter [Mycobacterium sp. JS623]|nr:putative RND superfamily drug exporter [Mycobacterium sp. JS623]
MDVLARWLARYAGWIVAVVSVLFVLFGLYSAHLNSRLSGGGWTVPGSEEARAEQAQDAGFIGRGSSSVALLVHDDRFSAPSAEFEDRVAGVIRQVTADPRLQIRSQPDWRSLTGPQKDEALGRDARTTLTTLELGIDDDTAKRVLPEVERGLSVFNEAGLRVHLVGQAASVGAVNEVGAAALSRIELILLPLVIAILLVLYRSVAAALVSLAVSVTAIVIAMGVMTWVAGVAELTVAAQTIATMLGLGVTVDYSLVMIRRFIDELRVLDRAAALANTMRTAGRTVAASGATVAAALTTLLIVNLPLIRSMAVTAVIVVVVAVITCLIALPAVLYLLGSRATAWRVPWLPSSRDPARRRWERVARTIMARPVAALAITSIALLGLAVPALGLQTGGADASALPKSSSVRQGNDLVEEQYGKNAVDPILVVIEAERPFSGTKDFARLEAMTTSLGQLDHVVRVASPVPLLHTVMPADPFAAIEPTNFQLLPADSRTLINRFVSADRNTIAVDVFSNEGAGDSNVATLLGEVRTVAKHTAAPGWHISVGGTAAIVLSASQHISDASPIVIAIMLVTIYLLLVLALRSLLLPCKAIALNLLSVGASVGAVVLIFQHGFLAGTVGIESVGPIQNFVPILLVTVLFSLSTDYEVFLLSRVRERYELTGDNTESVTYGLVETAPLISGAALLMVTIFAAFVAVPMVTVQQTGLAAAIAIAIDATVVRLVMVPAAMRLMGRWNWWLPRWMTPYRGRHRRGPSCAPSHFDEVGAQCVP